MPETCPYHDEECAETRRPPAGAGLGVAACGFPVRFCPRCGGSNRTYARFCRTCALRLDPAGAEPHPEALVRALWTAAGPEPATTAATLDLPASSGRVTVVAAAWSFLFLGTSMGRVFMLDGMEPGRVLEVAGVPGRVLGIEPIPESDGTPKGPALLATTSEGVYRLSLIPALDVEPVWTRAADETPAAAAIPLEGGSVAFRARDGVVDVLWLSWRTRGTTPPVAGSMAGPVGQPVALPATHAFFCNPETPFVFNGPNGAPETLRVGSATLVPEPSYPPSYEPVSGELFFVYRRDQAFGIGRVSASELAPRRCTEPVYASAQVLAIDSSLVCVASDHDLELISPVTGLPAWSLKRNVQVDDLNLAEFQPVRSAGHLVMVGRTGGRSDSLYLLPIDERGRKEGPRRFADAGRVTMRPVVVPGGVVCVSRGARGEETVHVIRPRRWSDA